MPLLVEDRRCQDYDVVSGTSYHAHDLPRCRAAGVEKIKGKWLCWRHAEKARAASSALVPLSPGRCPSCGSTTVREAVQEQPLLRHGGYGAARRTVTDHCSSPTCQWWLTTDISEERPA